MHKAYSMLTVYKKTTCFNNEKVVGLWGQCSKLFGMVSKTKKQIHDNLTHCCHGLHEKCTKESYFT